jgi:hypothetical protein
MGPSVSGESHWMTSSTWGIARKSSCLAVAVTTFLFLLASMQAPCVFSLHYLKNCIARILPKKNTLSFQQGPNLRSLFLPIAPKMGIQLFG